MANKKVSPTIEISQAKSDNFVTLRSSVNYQVEIRYNNEAAFVPPLGTLKNVTKSLLSFPLPTGVKIVNN